MVIRFRRRSPPPTWNDSPALSAEQLAARCDLKRLIDGLQRLVLVAPNAVRVIAEIVAGFLDEVDP